MCDLRTNGSSRAQGLESYSCKWSWCRISFHPQRPFQIHSTKELPVEVWTKIWMFYLLQPYTLLSLMRRLNWLLILGMALHNLQSLKPWTPMIGWWLQGQHLVHSWSAMLSFQLFLCLQGTHDVAGQMDPAWFCVLTVVILGGSEFQGPSQVADGKHCGGWYMCGGHNPSGAAYLCYACRSSEWAGKDANHPNRCCRVTDSQLCRMYHTSVLAARWTCTNSL